VSIVVKSRNPLSIISWGRVYNRLNDQGWLDLIVILRFLAGNVGRRKCRLPSAEFKTRLHALAALARDELANPP
jgi:hypothetical protein